MPIQSDEERIVAKAKSYVRNAVIGAFFGEYRSLKYFEENILDRLLRDAPKAVFPQYTVDGLLKNRQEAGVKIDAMLDEKLKGYPITVLRAQIEDVSPPVDYLNAVREKEKARERAAQELHELERAKLVSEREVQQADAEARAVLLRKKAEADGIKLVGEARANAAALLAKAPADNPALVGYKIAETWNGTAPTYASSANPLTWFQMPVPEKK